MQQLEPADLKSLQAVTVTARIISVAMAISIAMFGFVLKLTDRLVFDFEKFQSNLMSDQLTQIFTMLALIMFAMHLFIPKLLLQHTPAATAQAKIQKFAAANTVRVAMLESTALMGFLVAMLNNEATLYAIFAALTIATIFATIPTEDSIREQIGLK